MKLAEREWPTLLRNPGRFRAILLVGENATLIRARARLLAQAVAGSLDDPFRLGRREEIDAETLKAEAAQIPLSGGRYVLWVGKAGDSLVKAMEETLAGPGDAFLLLEGVGLETRSRLRKLFETSRNAALLFCEAPTGAVLASMVGRFFAARKVFVSTETTAAIAAAMDGEYGVIERELEKLALYAGEGGALEAAEALAILADSGQAGTEDLWYAAMAGHIAEADRMAARLIESGESAVGVLRWLLALSLRLWEARAVFEEGTAWDEAIDSLRPPIFFRRRRAFAAIAAASEAHAVAAVVRRLRQAERDAKRTGVPAETLLHHGVLALAAAAREKA